jgi:putative hydrolase of the HAD superfamily
VSGGIRLISFDLWSTLVRGNAAYKWRRAELAAAAFGGADPAAMAAAIDAAAQELDDLTERTGVQHGFAERIAHVARLLGVAELSGAQHDALAEAMSAAFAENLPSLTEPTLPQTLAGLRGLGLSVAVTSNTGFTPGRLVRTMLDRLGILGLADHLVFSDELGYAKPSAAVYRHLVALGGGTADQTLHIGDNRIADFEGARAAGLHALWYRPGGQAGDGVLLRHRDLFDHPLLQTRATSVTRSGGPQPR